MEGNMFCYQCQEAAKGTGCVLKGVCGKKIPPHVTWIYCCLWCAEYP